MRKQSAALLVSLITNEQYDRNCMEEEAYEVNTYYSHMLN